MAIVAFVVGDLAYGAMLPRLHPDGFFRADASQIRGTMRTYDDVLIRSDRDYPHPKDPRELVVGVFGGSVAVSFAASLEGGRLERTPAAVRLGEVTGRRVHVENFALSGGSEPTQFNMLHLFHGQLDVAVFLDGYNEIMRYRASEPPNDCADLAPFWAEHEGRTDELLAYPRELGAEARAWADSPRLGLLLASGLFRMHLYRTSQDLRLEVDEYYRTMQKTRRPLAPASPMTMDGASRWLGCARLSAAYAAKVGVPIHFFVQPNQYVKGSKPWSDEELATAFHREHEVPDELFRSIERVSDTYAELGAHAETLRAEGVHARSLAQVFADTRETVYVDKCCHVNLRGNAIIADAVFGDLLRSFEGRPAN